MWHSENSLIVSYIDMFGYILYFVFLNDVTAAHFLPSHHVGGHANSVVAVHKIGRPVLTSQSQLWCISVQCLGVEIAQIMTNNPFFEYRRFKQEKMKQFHRRDDINGRH